MKINIWIKEEDIEILKELVKSDGIGPYLRKKYKDFEYYRSQAGPIVTGGEPSIKVSLDFDSFIKIRDNFEGV